MPLTANRAVAPLLFVRRSVVMLSAALALAASGCAESKKTASVPRTGDPLVDGRNFIAQGPEKDKVLWQYRTALAALRKGQEEEAKAILDDALLTIGMSSAKDKDAKKSRGYFNEESRKTFRGEPYERVMAYYYRGILYWKDGEADNARACFRSAQLQDSDTENKEYASDYVLLDYLDEESRLHFDGLKSLLDTAGISYQVNPRLVRGLDYYGKTAFEWVTDKLGSQATVCAGGRYDGLVEQLGGKSTPAVGFGIGLERLVLLVQAAGAMLEGLEQQADIYLVAVGDVQQAAMQLAERIRNELPFVRLLTHCGGGSFKNQLKKADKCGADIALILGEDEAREGKVAIKFLREDVAQQTLGIDDALQYLQSFE